MLIKNTTTKYGLISKLFHWTSAFVIIGLYIMGKWMEDLDYYSEWYTDAPFWHKSIGITLLSLTILRLCWKLSTASPAPIKTHSNTIKRTSLVTHYIMYILLFVAMLSGYLISTADGRGIEVFNLFFLPSLGELVNNQEDVAGKVHELTTNGVILLAIFHIIGALKHHFFDKDETLIRMLK